MIVRTWVMMIAVLLLSSPLPGSFSSSRSPKSSKPLATLIKWEYVDWDAKLWTPGSDCPGSVYPIGWLTFNTVCMHPAGLTLLVVTPGHAQYYGGVWYGPLSQVLLVPDKASHNGAGFVNQEWELDTHWPAWIDSVVIQAASVHPQKLIVLELSHAVRVYRP